MAWFGSLAISTRLGEPFRLEPGEWTAGLEAGWIPTLSEEDRRVGFDGTKVEDLNRSPVLGRVRGAVGLPGRLVLGLSWTPPVEVDGLEANLGSASLGGGIPLGQRWDLGIRGMVTVGELQGDVTCDRAAASAGDDPEKNPFRCREPSRDEMELRVGSIEVTVSRESPDGRWGSSVGLVGSWFDNEFRVDARYGDLVDRSVLLSEHGSAALTIGLGYRPAARWSWAGEIFYSPLRVERSTGVETDGLLHARLHLSYRVR